MPPFRTASLGMLWYVIVSMTAFAEQPENLLTSSVAQLFGSPPTIGDPKLSPDGTHLAFLQQDESGVTVLQALDLEDGSTISLLKGSESGYEIFECHFANRMRLLCDLRNAGAGQLIDYQVWVALDVDGSNVLRMPRGTGCGDINVLRNTHRIDWMADDPEHVIFSCGPTTQLINLYGGQETHRFGELNARQLYTDGAGFANLYYGRFGAHERWYFRADDSADWILVHEADITTFSDPFRPVGFDSESRTLLHIGWNQSTKTWGLFERDPASLEDRVLFAHEAVDVELVNTVGPDERVVSVMYIEGRTAYKIIDERISEVHALLSRQLPGTRIEILDESWDSTVYLARIQEQRRAGYFIVVDMKDSSIEFVGQEYIHLTETDLSDTRLVQFPGRNGRQISGHLTVPTDLGTPVPAIIVPRGEAAHREIPDPHYLVEFLAARGFAVLRVDTPGPDHLGGWLPSRIEMGWEQAADSISDAVDFLVDTGVTKSDTVCAAGKDYGAYAALMSAIKYPDIFRCVVSIGGIANPREGPHAPAITDIVVVPGVTHPFLRSFGDGTPMPEVNRRVQAVGPSDPGKGSPIERAAEIRAPVLMFQGMQNYLVQAREHALPLRNALERAGKEVSLIEYDYDDHLISRWPSRTDMLVRTEQFLMEHLGEHSVRSPTVNDR